MLRDTLRPLAPLAAIRPIALAAAAGVAGVVCRRTPSPMTWKLATLHIWAARGGDARLDKAVNGVILGLLDAMRRLRLWVAR